MAARESYSIQASLNRSAWDQEFAIAGKNPSIPRLPLKVIIFYLLSFVLIIGLITSSFVGASPLPIRFLWLIDLIALTAFLGAFSKSQMMNLTEVPVMLAWLPPSARRLVTRFASNPSDFMKMMNIASVTRDGLVTFLDGTIGRVYLVAGSASNMLFDMDRNAMLNHIDSFWRNFDMQCKCEAIEITLKEPQRVETQVANLKRTYDAFDVDEPDLVALMDKQLFALNYVGNKNSTGRSLFTSIHQYYILKARDLSSLKAGHNNFTQEASRSNLTFKQCTVLDQDDINQLLRSIYTTNS